MDPVLDVQVGLAGWSRLSRLIRYREESGDICRQLGWYREQPRPYGGGVLFFIFQRQSRLCRDFRLMMEGRPWI